MKQSDINNSNINKNNINKSNINIRRAALSDMAAVLEIYEDARQYMKEQGNTEQWRDNYPAPQLVENDINSGNCYVYEKDNEIGGVFYFAIGNDPVYNNIAEGEWRNDRQYGVVHRIAVGKNFHNQGIAGNCIAYVVGECKKNNIYDIRMDTHSANLPMQGFLEKQDFRKCGRVYVEDGSERIAYHKIIIRNVVFDIGQVLLEFDWKKFIGDMNISEEKKEQLAHVTLGNIPHWNEHDRGMSDEDFVQKSLLIEPDIKEELKYYLEHIGTIAREYDHSVPLIRSLKAQGYGVYLLSNYGVTPFRYAKEHMKFFDEVDGMIISHEVGVIKPEPEIYKLLFERYGLVPEECVFIDDRADNIAAAEDMGMSGIVFEDIEQVKKELERMLGNGIKSGEKCQ